MEKDLNTKILNVVQKGFNEALSNYDLIVLDRDDSVLVKNNTYKHSSIYDDIMDRFSDFLNDDKMFKSIVEKMLLVNRQYTVKDKDELNVIIKRSVKIFGNECDLNWIDTSLITNMTELFSGMKDFNGHIEKWDVSNVKNMDFMFYYAESFNQPIGDWNVGNVKDMSYMFFNADSFNQPIDNWNVSNVTDMSYMFAYTIFFNQPINNWNINAENMSYIFAHTKSFNQLIDNWNVSNVKYMTGMFYDALSFNQPLENWNVSHVKDMRFMFNQAASFNQPLNNWDINNENTLNMFLYCPIKEEYKPKFKNQ